MIYDNKMIPDAYKDDSSKLLIERLLVLLGLTMLNIVITKHFNFNWIESVAFDAATLIIVTIILDKIDRIIALNKELIRVFERY